ncbi:hypothetical protein F5Y15DRAFT_149149 [Xylariaceae sp. FL0016]|nr:hypothetical protein F5Y15DRAFT_149149 [Xylariaceae sp. FL0016]
MVTQTPDQAPNNDNNSQPPPPHVTVQGMRQELWSHSDSESNTAKEWEKERSTPALHHDTANQNNSNNLSDAPGALRPGNTSTALDYDRGEDNPWSQTTMSPTNEPKGKLDDVPSPLRPGPSRTETNPFKRKPIQNGPSPNIVPTIPAGAPPQPLTASLTQLHLTEPEQSTNPWQPALDESKARGITPPPAELPGQGSDSNVWDSGPPSRQPSTGPASNSPALVAVQSTGSSQPWDNAPPKATLPPLQEKSAEAEEVFGDQHAWDEMGSTDKGKRPDVSQPQMQTSAIDGWNLIDHEPVAEPQPGDLSRRSSWENFADADDEEPKDETHDVPVPPSGDIVHQQPPALPPRRSTEAVSHQAEIPPPQPARPQTPGTSNKTETYQIKIINWFDAKATKNPRKSPILVQNANGPCPLVALVNALTLTTPAEQTNSNLVETLRSREQISLNFLLEAVFDELMTSRHSNSGAELPDMPELYSFLKGLHTGMNVNPRFLAPPGATAQGANVAPGTFEDTRDMKLYATFSIPLVHGWLPPRDDPVYDAFSRQASSYDDASCLMFREEELEDKLGSAGAGLSEQEQQLYQDIVTIKSFLTTSATQLTPWGLDVITQAIQPGTVSILFRNDHFSTLYRHPQTRQLFTLVTDAGYHTHDEVVWESLVDVRGERSAFFSGDFRVVGGGGAGNSDGVGTSNSADGGAWQTVQNRRPRNGRDSESTPNPPHSPGHEQEDHDLALALQLQEEEEQRHRTEVAARRRESQLSEQFIEQQGRQGNRNGPRNRGGSVSRGGGNPMIQARSSSTSLGRGGRPVQQVRSLIPPANTTHRPTDSETVDDAPPSYEQASKATPYHPPAGHPSHPESSPSSSTPRRGIFNGSSRAGPSNPVRGGRQAAPPVTVGTPSVNGNTAKDRDCIVM